MNIKPFSLIDDDENDNDNNSVQTRFSSRMKKATSSGDNMNNSKKSLNSGNASQNVNTAKKENQMKDLGINNQQKIVNDFREKAAKEKLFENLNNLNNIINKNSTIGQNQNNIKNDPSLAKEIKEQQDMNNKNNEDVKENKLTKNLLNEKKDKKNSYYGKLYFVIAISMLLYQYFSYIFFIELPIIQGKYMKLILIIFY